MKVFIQSYDIRALSVLNVMVCSQYENYTSNDGSTQEVTSSDVGPEATETGTACEAVGQL